MNSASEITVRIESANNQRVLRVAGPVDLANAAALRQALVDVLADSDAGCSAIVDLAAATAVDFSGMQLLCSAHRSFRERGSAMSLRDVPDWLRQAAAAAGFTMPTLACRYRQGDDCLWRD
jgi:anti-anti-sigma factor